MSYPYLNEESVRKAQYRIRVKLKELAEMEAQIDSRIEQLQNEPPFRVRGEWAECGTHSGYKTHIINRTTPCQQCREARALYQREYRRRKKNQEIAA
jgi:hypothetical protein